MRAVHRAPALRPAPLAVRAVDKSVVTPHFQAPVKTPADVLGLMQRAQLRRQVGETKMNKQSSRSHCLFTLKVHSKKIVSADGSVMECTGKLHLVDLAGSECAKTAGTDKVDPAKERERKNINQSLLTLGRVIR